MGLDAKTREKAFFLVLAATALTALAAGLSEGVYGNFYYEVYGVTAFQRGFIEFPRELPGFLTVLAVSLFAFAGEIRLAIAAQALAVAGLLLLGVFTPSFGLMLVFLFINSMGMHLYMPLKDSIALGVIGPQGTGRKFGLLNGARTAAGFVAGLLVFAGFRSGFFSFQHSPVRNFVIAAGLFAAVALVLARLRRLIGDPPITTGKGRFLVRKEYRLYYALASLHGAHKQIAGVFGPWVLISLLGRGADVMALLSMAGMFLGIFFIPLAGRLTDRLGYRRMMFAEGGLFIAIYAAFGLLSAGLSSGGAAAGRLPAAAVYALLVFDRMTMQLGMLRSLYLRDIALDKSEVSPTLSMGMSIDHVISIAGAFLGGVAWEAWGPEYVFYIAAALSFGNVAVARFLPTGRREEGGA